MTEVMWLTPVAPARTGGGGSIRQAHLLSALAGGASVRLVSSQPVEDPFCRAVAEVVELGVGETDWGRRPSSLRRTRDLVVGVHARTPREVIDFAPVRRAMATVLDRESSPVVVVEYAGLAPLVRRRRPGQRWVLTLHNIPYRLSAHAAAVARGRRRWLLARDVVAAERWQRRVLPLYDLVITASDEDAEVARAHGAAAVEVVPNGVDLDYFSPGPVPDAPVVLFSGALYTGPNRDAATWLAREIWPLVVRSVPDARLEIVGARPGGDVMGLAGGSIRVRPDVADIRPFLRAARVAAVAVRIGSGTRLKALEAMAAGRPLIGTSIGLEGIGVQDGLQAAVADTPQDFARSIVRAFTDPHWASGLAAEGRRLVEQRYGWPGIGARFRELVLRLS